MQKGLQNHFTPKPLADLLFRSAQRAEQDTGELPRLDGIIRATDKINRMILTDLMRLKAMGLAPTPENAVIPYHG